VIDIDHCIQCGTPATHGSIMITRPRPMKSSGEYTICFPCARRVRREQDERAQAAIKEAERAGVA
jgi:hypothetical protein